MGEGFLHYKHESLSFKCLGFPIGAKLIKKLYGNHWLTLSIKGLIHGEISISTLVVEWYCLTWFLTLL